MKKQFLLFLFMVPFVLSAQDITSELVAHYQFNDDYADATGNGHDGTAIGAPEFVQGIDGNAVLFHGEEGSAIDAILTNIQFAPTGSFSISLFFKVDKFDNANKFKNVLIGDRGDDGTGFQIRQFASAVDWTEIAAADGGWLCFTTRGIGSDKSFDPRAGEESTDIKYEEDMPYMKALYPTTEFVHGVFVVDTENQKKQIWLDNELIVDGNITLPNEYVPALDGDFIMIGARNDGSGTQTPEGSFYGSIDEVRIYSKALAAADIDALYSEFSGTAANEISGNSNDIHLKYVNGIINYEVQLKNAENVTTNIFDLNGRLVQQSFENGISGLNKLSINAEQLSKGMYIVKVSHSGNNISKKLVIR